MSQILAQAKYTHFYKMLQYSYIKKVYVPLIL